MFFRVFEMCIINAMVVYFDKNPNFTAKKRSHKKFGEMLILELILPLLDERADNCEEVRECVASQKDRSSQLKVENNVRLKGQHFAVKSKFRWKFSRCGCEKTWYRNGLCKTHL